MLTNEEIQNIITRVRDSIDEITFTNVSTVRREDVEPLLQQVITETLRAVGTKTMCSRHAPHAKHNLAAFEKLKEEGGDRTRAYVVECSYCMFMLGENKGFAAGKGRGEADGKMNGREEMLRDIASAVERALRRLVEAE